MGYKNGKEILPEDLILEIQKFVDGECVYIPRTETTRKKWCENTDASTFISKRNEDIYTKYMQGIRVADLSEEYNLSKQGIYKIISKYKR